MLKHTVLKAASGLLGDSFDIENVESEYIRAIVELTSDLIGASTDDYDETLREILDTRP